MGGRGYCVKQELEFYGSTEFDPDSDPDSDSDFDKISPASCDLIAQVEIFRTWLSTNKDRKGVFGPGWSSLLDTSIVVYPNDITYYDDEYQAIEFDKIAAGQTSKAPGQGVTLSRHEQSIEVTDSQGRTFHFSMDHDSGKIYWLRTLTRFVLRFRGLPVKSCGLCLVDGAPWC